MNQNARRDWPHQRLNIEFIRSRGLSVNELVRKMKMSYMGIKQHCLTLQRDGYLIPGDVLRKWAGRKWSIV
jgi:hypothetical protein